MWPPEPARRVWGRLSRTDTTWLVGGSVRGYLLARQHREQGNPVTADVDLATAMRPDQVWQHLNRMGLHPVRTGMAWGRVAATGVFGHVDVTTFREDAGVFDHRHPERVQFTRDGLRDLWRRDFTVNAMALTREGRLVDVTAGQRHLRDRRLVAVGSPILRLLEDALRIWRAVRFLSYGPGAWTWDRPLAMALAEQAASARAVPAERIGHELLAILKHEHPERALMAAHHLGLLPPWTAASPDLTGIGPGARLAILQWAWQDDDLGTRFALPKAIKQQAKSLRDWLTGRRHEGSGVHLAAEVATRLQIPWEDPWTLSGRDLMRDYGLEPGPRLGQLLTALRIWAAGRPERREPAMVGRYVQEWRASHGTNMHEHGGWG